MHIQRTLATFQGYECFKNFQIHQSLVLKRFKQHGSTAYVHSYHWKSCLQRYYLHADSKLKSTLVLLNLAELCADDRCSWY